jgi:ribosomal protein S16
MKIKIQEYGRHTQIIYLLLSTDTNTRHDTYMLTPIIIYKNEIIECTHICLDRVQHQTHLQSKVSVIHSLFDTKAKSLVL